MIRPRIIPCLLLKDKGLVKSIKFKDHKYIGDPFNAVKIFNEKETDELIILDIMASKENRKPDFDYLEKIASEAFMPMSYGGGITEIDDIKTIFKIGYEKVCINTYALIDSSLIRLASDMFGSQSITAAIDVKKNIFGKYEVYTKCGMKNTKKDCIVYAKELELMGAGELFVNSIDRDGTMLGYDIELIKQISHSVKIPVVACGGAGKVSDLFDVILQGGASAAAAGSIFVYHGKYNAVLISYPQIDDYIKKNNIVLKKNEQK